MAVDAEEAGMDAFMDKPFKLEELTAVYIKLLERENRNQRDIPTQPTAVPLGVDTDTPSGLGVVARGPRSIRKVTPNVKIFVDASEVDDVTASPMGGDISSLEQDGSSTIAAVVVQESDKKGMVETVTAQPSAGSGSGNGMIGGIKNNSAKVYAVN